MTSLAHFYHVYADGHWEQALTEHCYALRHYGLLDALDEWFVGFVGTDENVGYARAILDVNAPGYQVCAVEPQGWEQTTLEPLWHWTRRRRKDWLVSYGHTKGASRFNPVDEPWRQAMTYHCFVDWQRPVAALNDGYPIAGCHWFNGGPSTKPGFGHGGMFGGNFWWTHSDLLRLNPPPDRISRHHAEHWLGQLCEVTPLTEMTIVDLNPGPIGRVGPNWLE